MIVKKYGLIIIIPNKPKINSDAIIQKIVNINENPNFLFNKIETHRLIVINNMQPNIYAFILIIFPSYF